MSILSTVFIILIILSSILLVLVVLVQKSKGGGLASGFSSPNAILGVKKATDSVEKATWALACSIMIFSLATVAVSTRSHTGTAVKVIETPATGAPDMSGDLPLTLPSEPAVPNNE